MPSHLEPYGEDFAIGARRASDFFNASHSPSLPFDLKVLPGPVQVTSVVFIAHPALYISPFFRSQIHLQMTLTNFAAALLVVLAFAGLPESAARPTRRSDVQATSQPQQFVDVVAFATGQQLVSDAPYTTPSVTQLFLSLFAPVSNSSQTVVGASTISGNSSFARISADAFDYSKIGADSSYWDFQVDGDNTSYSFVDAATAQGFPVFTYDRLSTGKSTRPEGVNTVQVSIQIEIAHQLVQKIRTGWFESLECEKVIGIGHSFGSIQTQNLASRYAKDLDAAVLTGFSLSQAGVPAAFSAMHPTIASETSTRFRSVNDTSYWTWDDPTAGQYFFLHYPGFSPAAAARFESTKATFTLGEFVTLSSITTPALNFSGPVTTVTGEQDLPFCAGNCWSGPNGSSILPNVASLFPLVQAFSTQIIPNSGHALNVHLSAPSTYSYVLDWATSHGF
ncbi:hypothetical protein P7C70_g1999, partial [Phenoliferia sp. Uapishka_3]